MGSKTGPGVLEKRKIFASGRIQNHNLSPLSLITTLIKLSLRLVFRVEGKSKVKCSYCNRSVRGSSWPRTS